MLLPLQGARTARTEENSRCASTDAGIWIEEQRRAQPESSRGVQALHHCRLALQSLHS